MLFQPKYAPYDPIDKACFAYETVVKRWPVIITGVIDQLHNSCHALMMDSKSVDADVSEKIAEGKSIIEKISKLKYEMGRDHALDPLPADSEAHVQLYNEELDRLAKASKNTWFTAPWLYAECYLYRFLRSFFAMSKHWRTYDPFHAQKIRTFQQSGTSIFQIANTMHELEVEKAILDSDKVAILFKEMLQMCLWGNATDLSLLTHMSAADIEHLQAVGKDAQAARQKFILKDDQDAVWQHVKSLKSGRVDFILDNAGFELFTDLVFADFLVSYTSHVSKVYFHPKLIPWFVSDVTPADFSETISSLLDPSFFTQSMKNREQILPPEHLKQMVARWQSYIDRGIFSLSVPVSTELCPSNEASLAEFWTTPYPYWNLADRDPALFSTLRKSDLVIFKGDLNYRKLTGDIRWPSWTPFSTAIGPLAGAFPLLSLRTNKADVVVGVPKDVVEQLEKSGQAWRVDGRYALISFVEGSLSV